MIKQRIFTLMSFLWFLLLLPFFGSQNSNVLTTQGSNKEIVCAVFFEGIGCPHCTRIVPVIQDLLKQYSQLVVIEYEVRHQRENAEVIKGYFVSYNIGSGGGIPFLILNNEKKFIGDTPIQEGLSKSLNEIKTNPCPLKNNKSIDFNTLDLNTLPGIPKIWARGRVLVTKESKDRKGDVSLLRKLLLADNLSQVVIEKTADIEVTQPQEINSGTHLIKFDKAIKVGDWVFQWNGPMVEVVEKNLEAKVTTTTSAGEETEAPWVKKSKGILEILFGIVALFLIILAIIIHFSTPAKAKDVER